MTEINPFIQLFIYLFPLLLGGTFIALVFVILIKIIKLLDKKLKKNE